MHRIKTIAKLLLLLLLFSTACKKEAVQEQPTPPAPASGTATEEGTPDGTPISKSMGTSGGTITSTDGKITVQIPSGALNSNQTITIQPISNHSPLGINKAYRLTPHDLQFAKPVTVTFKYSTDDIAGTVPEALGIAYQDKKGVWQSVNATKLNKGSKTVSVNTTHFSDWAFFEAFTMEPWESTAVVGTTVNLKVLYTVPDADLLVDLAPTPESPLSEPKDLAANFVKKWTLTGEGILVSRQNKATYTAPEQVPQDNPVQIAVSLDLLRKGQFTLVARVTVVDDEYVLITAGAGVGGGTTKLTGVPMAVHLANINRTEVTAFMEGGTTTHFRNVRLVFPGAKGSYGWNRNGHVNFTYIVRAGGAENTVYNETYSNGITWFNSPGTLHITHYGAVGEHITGTFTIPQSGYADGEKTTTTVTGKFSVIRRS